MAETTTTYSGQRVDELLRCPVCLDRFNQPKILPCQHTFCYNPCLQGLVDLRSRILRCPECRAEHLIPSNGANGFPNNLIISNFLDLQPQAAKADGPVASSSSASAPGACTICEKSAETSKCGHCNKYLCAACCKSHYTQLKFDVGRLVNQIRKGIPKLSDSLSQVEQKGEQVKQHVASVKSEVRDAIARYVTQLKDREKMLNSELDTFMQGELRNLRLKQENIEVELASISSYCDSTEGLLNRAGTDIPTPELTAIKEQCKEYKTQLVEAGASDNLDTKLIKFGAEGQALVSGITNLGTLVVTTPGQATSRNTNRPPPVNNRNNRNQNDRTNPTRRSRWSSPQPLHELYTRDANTPPPPTTPPTARSTANQSFPTTGATRHIRGRPVSNWNNVSRIQNSPFQTNSTNSPRNNFYSRMNETSQRTPNLGNYMFRMDTSDQRNPFLDQPRVSPGSVLSIGTNASPRRSTHSSMFGTYSPGRAPEERAVGIIPGLNSTRIPEDDYATADSIPGFVSINASQAAAAMGDVPSRDSRASVAFSVDLDEEPGRRLGRRPPRLSRGRNGARRGGCRNNTRRSNNSTRNAPEESPSSSTSSASQGPNTYRAPARSQQEPQPSTSNAPVEDNPVIPMYRSTTFVLDGSNNGGENTNNNNSSEALEQTPSVSNQGNNSEQNMQPSTSSEVDIIDWNDESVTVTSSKNKYEKKGKVNKTIGSTRGSQPGSFTWPRGVSFSPRDKRILVADSSNHRVQIFDSSAKFVHQFGVFGTAAGEFDCLAGITCAESGDIVIADRYNHRVQVFDRDGTLQKMFGREGIGNGQLSYPWGIALDSKKNVYVVDKENHRIQVFTWDGAFLRSISGFGEETGRMRHPSYVAVAPDNRVIVSDTENHRIQVFTPKGRHLTSFGSSGSEKGQLRSPKGVAVDRQGFIIVADCGNSRVQVFRGNGQHYCEFGSHGRGKGQFKSLEGLTLTPDGKIIISDKETHKIQVF